MDKEFEKRNANMIKKMGEDEHLKETTRKWFAQASKYEYSYHFKWLGRPIIQYPQDIIALQEIIWEINPDLIIETGIARGGSLIFYASILELLGGDGRVLGIDIDIREHNKIEIQKHRMINRITMLEGSSVSEKIINQVKNFARGKKKVLVILDSNHTHNHVIEELERYSPFVTKGSYLVVFDTVVEDMPIDFVQNRPWSKGNNPKTAVWEFLKQNDIFEVDKKIEDKLQITVGPSGFLKRVK